MFSIKLLPLSHFLAIDLFCLLLAAESGLAAAGLLEPCLEPSLAYEDWPNDGL